MAKHPLSLTDGLRQDSRAGELPEQECGGAARKTGGKAPA